MYNTFDSRVQLLGPKPTTVLAPTAPRTDLLLVASIATLLKLGHGVPEIWHLWGIATALWPVLLRQNRMGESTQTRVIPRYRSSPSRTKAGADTGQFGARYPPRGKTPQMASDA